MTRTDRSSIPSAGQSRRGRPYWQSAIVAVIIGLSLQGSTVTATQATGGGSIRGHVIDSTGGAVPAANVTASSPNVAGAFRAVSDGEGNYILLDLPPATDYTVSVERNGFSKFLRKDIVVRSGLNTSSDVELKVGTDAQIVEVSAGEAPVIDTFSTEQTVEISGELLRDLPLTGRREWSDALQLVPGILSASTDAYGGQVYFVRGSENENHATLLDGADVGSFKQNWPSNFISISTESLGDIQVKTGASDASSPSAMGMVINMASPTGGDQFHGVAAFLASPRGWNSQNNPGGVSAVSQAFQPDFSFSGPLKKGRAWFFASGRYINRNDGISRTPLQLNLIHQADPAFVPFDNHSAGFVYVTNATVQLTDKHKLFGLVQYDSRTQGGNDETYAGDFATNQYGGGAYELRLSSTWSDKLVTRFMASYNNKSQNDSLERIGGIPDQPSITVFQKTQTSNGHLVGNTTLGVLNNLSSKSVSPAHKTTFSYDSTYLTNALGSHQIQAGVYLQPHMATKSQTFYANGGFNSEDDVLFDANNPAAGYVAFHRHYVDSATSESGLLTSYIGANDYAWYLQDKWQPIRKLTVSAGLRADWVSAQDWLFHVTTQHSWNYAPRVGVTYDLTPSHKHVLRASWGKVTDIPNAGYFSNAGSNVVSSRDEYDNNLDGIYETVLTTPASTLQATNRTVDPKRHQGYVEEWIAGYRTELPGKWAFDSSYIVRDYKDRPASVEINQVYNGNVWVGLVDPTQNSITLSTNNKWNWFVYQGLEFTLTKQGRRIQSITTYTRAWDHIAGTWQPGDPASFIQPDAFPNNQGIGTVRGNSTNSFTGDTRNRSWQKHQFRTALSWKAPWKLQVSANFSAQSGIPTGPIVTTIAAADPQFGPTSLVINGRTVTNPLATTTRFAYATRGDGQLWTPWLFTTNARIGRKFITGERQSLEVDLDLFNIPNAGAAQQPLGGNNITGSTFGSFQNIQVPRQEQVTVRWSF